MKLSCPIALLLAGAPAALLCACGQAQGGQKHCRVPPAGGEIEPLFDIPGAFDGKADTLGAADRQAVLCSLTIEEAGANAAETALHMLSNGREVPVLLCGQPGDCLLIKYSEQVGTITKVWEGVPCRGNELSVRCALIRAAERPAGKSRCRGILPRCKNIAIKR